MLPWKDACFSLGLATANISSLSRGASDDVVCVLIDVQPPDAVRKRAADDLTGALSVLKTPNAPASVSMPNTPWPEVWVSSQSSSQGESV